MRRQGSSQSTGDDLIGSATTPEEIVDALAKRGCSNLTPSIDLDNCGQFPCAGGGFCDVYRGVLRNGTEIAIKSLRVYDTPGDSERRKILKRAARELYHWSKLQHPNVLPLLGLVIFRGQISMVSEWMDNGNLMSYLKLKPDADRNRLCMDICEGLCYIHINKMVHGDLKAANIMVSARGTAMIADFGNTQLKEVTLRFSNTTKGGFSVRWTAPELLLADTGPEVSKEADVYAYGMTVLETLTGKVPYEGTSDNRIFILVAVDKKLPPRPDVSIGDDLWNLLNLCWSREPVKRPDITSVRDNLQAVFWPSSDTGPSGSASSRPFPSSTEEGTGRPPRSRQGSFPRIKTILRNFPVRGSPTSQAKPEISIPYDLVHLAHGDVNPSTGEFTGVPEEWQQILSGGVISRVELERSPETVMKVMESCQETQGAVSTDDLWDMINPDTSLPKRKPEAPSTSNGSQSPRPPPTLPAKHRLPPMGQPTTDSSFDHTTSQREASRDLSATRAPPTPEHKISQDQHEGGRVDKAAPPSHPTITGQVKHTGKPTASRTALPGLSSTPQRQEKRERGDRDMAPSSPDTSALGARCESSTAKSDHLAPLSPDIDVAPSPMPAHASSSPHLSVPPGPSRRTSRSTSASSMSLRTASAARLAAALNAANEDEDEDEEAAVRLDVGDHSFARYSPDMGHARRPRSPGRASSLSGSSPAMGLGLALGGADEYDSRVRSSPEPWTEFVPGSIAVAGVVGSGSTSRSGSRMNLMDPSVPVVPEEDQSDGEDEDEEVVVTVQRMRYNMQLQATA